MPDVTRDRCAIVRVQPAIERDPRQDPRPGDMLRKIMPSGKAMDRYVTGRKGNEVYYSKRQVPVPIKNCWITTWRTWAEDTVIGARGD